MRASVTTSLYVCFFLLVLLAGCAAVSYPLADVYTCINQGKGYGMADGQAQCLSSYPDSGKACTDEAQCAGSCIRHDAFAEPDALSSGQCSARRFRDSCHQFITLGHASPVICDTELGNLTTDDWSPEYAQQRRTMLDELDIAGCLAGGGVVTLMGYYALPGCEHVYADGGKTCQQGDDCTGECLAQVEPESGQVNAFHGVCAASDNLACVILFDGAPASETVCFGDLL